MKWLHDGMHELFTAPKTYSKLLYIKHTLYVEIVAVFVIKIAKRYFEKKMFKDCSSACSKFV